MLTLRLNTSDEKVYKEIFILKMYEKKNIKIEPNDSWLDLGANCGMFTLYCINKGVKFVRAVEPESENFELLKTNCGNYSNVELVKKAVDTTNNIKKLYIAKHTENKWRHTLLKTNGRKTIDVETTTLEELIDGIDCIKMDIEGTEIELLETVDMSVFKNIRKFIFEYSFDRDKSIPRFMNIIKKLQSIFYVQYNKVNPNELVFNYYPFCVNVYCIQKKKVIITKKINTLKEDLNKIIEIAKTYPLTKFNCNRVQRGLGVGTSIPFGKMKFLKVNGDLRTNKLFPNLYEEICKFGKKHINISWNAIMFNYNFKCNPHRDAKNVGDSYIVGFGDYTNGELVIEGIPHDIKYKPMMFNGFLKQHYNNDWEGERYSMVFFKTNYVE
jgi:FkbM family methyltransferase